MIAEEENSKGAAKEPSHRRRNIKPLSVPIYVYNNHENVQNYKPKTPATWVFLPGGISFPQSHFPLSD